MEQPYIREASCSWVKKVLECRSFNVWVAEEAVALQGPCVRCGHQLDDFVPLDLGYAKRFPRGKANTVPSKETLCEERVVRIPTVLACNCASDHKGRPDGALGCGSYGGLILHLESSPRRTLGGWNHAGSPPRVHLEADVARSAEKRWDEEAGDIEFKQLERVRGVAGKWSATVTAILGVFGVAALVEGADQIRKLDDTAAAWTLSLGLAAALTGLVALAVTALATQGLPRRVNCVTGATLRLRARKQAGGAAKLTKVGAAATVVSALLVIAGLGVLLSGSQEAAPATLIRVETVDRKVLCGQTRDVGPGRVAVEPPKGGRSVPVSLRDVRAITQVSDC